MLSVIALLAMLVQPPAGRQTDVPEAYQRMASSRQLIRTATIDASVERHFKSGPRFQYVTWGIAQADLLYVGRGDREGVVWRDEAGTPDASPRDLRMSMKAGLAGALWSHRESSIEAEVMPIRSVASVPDARTLGLVYGFTFRGFEEALWQEPVRGPTPREYRETVEGELHVVSIRCDVGLARWWIDPQKGWNPVRVALYDGDRIISQSRSVLREYDGIWFPESVQYFVNGYKEGLEPEIVVHVYHAEFNRPEHPQEFAPEDIGIVPGQTTVTRYPAQFGVDGERGFYDGEEFLTLDEYFGKHARRKADSWGDAARPGVAGAEAPASAAGATVRSRSTGTLETAGQIDVLVDPDTAWEACTRAFIERYQLFDAQQQKAWAICRECQQRAKAILSAHKGSLERLRTKATELEGNPDPQARQRREQALGELRLLCRPVDKIFETQLKPRLEKLPTRAQRAAVGPASAPTSP